MSCRDGDVYACVSVSILSVVGTLREPDGHKSVKMQSAQVSLKFSAI